ncbi:MAG: MgtC/SapB family protein [Firmicutes bacterium]|nr:MgtC/SapB family protein [Bacillota bacterium]
MYEILDFITELSPASVSVRLILATLMGSMIGMERANKRYAAGIRTFALVCLGSALATITGLYFAEMSDNLADSARIPAQLLCGIGFLGAGTIIVTDRKQIKGLTTAAGLWVTASMGIATGAGLLWAAIVCFALVLLTNCGLRYMTRYVETHTRTIELHIEMKPEALNDVLNFIKVTNGYKIDYIERRGDQPIFENDIILRIEIDMGKKIKHSVILNDVMELEGVNYVEEIG